MKDGCGGGGGKVGSSSSSSSAISGTGRRRWVGSYCGYSRVMMDTTTGISYQPC